MVVHVVLMWLRPEVSASDLGELARGVRDLVETVAGPIPASSDQTSPRSRYRRGSSLASC